MRTSCGTPTKTLRVFRACSTAVVHIICANIGRHPYENASRFPSPFYGGGASIMCEHNAAPPTKTLRLFRACSTAAVHSARTNIVRHPLRSAAAMYWCEQNAASRRTLWRHPYAICKHNILYDTPRKTQTHFSGFAQRRDDGRGADTHLLRARRTETPETQNRRDFISPFLFIIAKIGQKKGHRFMVEKVLGTLQIDFVLSLFGALD